MTVWSSWLVATKFTFPSPKLSANVAKTFATLISRPTVSFPLSVIDGSPGVEVGMVGSEGMVGAHLALGIVEAPLRCLVQGDGAAWRIAAADLRDVLTKSECLRAALNRYLYVLMAQLATSAACLRFHEIGPRPARWLLMSQDRAHSDQFQVTHEFLAYMLGVRRVGITNAASALQRRGLISYYRGDVIVVDRRGLQAAACGCYAEDKAAYTTLMS